ncbi:MAG: hypothetical protein EB084_20010 [Proteobacteria bacterium]|nr:hypothetical protein [Pseudomonadota bacterium]
MNHASTTGVAEACARVMTRARHVSIDDAAVAAVCDAWQHEPHPVPEWNRALHYFDGTRASANYVLVLDALNFCFWPDPGQPRWTVAYRDRPHTGYWALSAALKKAAEEGVPVLDAGWLAEVDRSAVERLLRGVEGEIPLMEHRVTHLQEVGRVLASRYDGQFANMVEDVGFDAVDLALRVAADLSSFDDAAVYDGERVPLFKRAQIVAVDLFGTFDGADCGRLTRLEALTAFADYKVPQVLRRLGVMRYDAALADVVDREVHIAPNDPMEVEIRAATVDAVERIRAGLATRGHGARAFEIDWFLWQLGQQRHADDRPYHKTRTVFY